MMYDIFTKFHFTDAILVLRESLGYEHWKTENGNNVKKETGWNTEIQKYWNEVGRKIEEYVWNS